MIRNGHVESIPISDLVPGDHVLLEMGNIIPADIRLTETIFFKTNESSLTGESIPVDKTHAALSFVDIPIAEQANMAFKGTHAVKGRAKGIVVAPGMHTEVGKIASMLKQEDIKTPLQLRMFDFSKKLTAIILGICSLIFRQWNKKKF